MHPRVLKYVRWGLALLVMVVLLGGCAPAAKPPVEPVLALVNGLLIDGNGGEPLADGVVIIQSGRITAVGASAQVSVPDGAQVIDVQGAAILPGFINSHVHDAFYADALEKWAWEGVTTVRDEGAHSDLKTALERRTTEWSDPKFARIVSAGVMMTKPGGYGGLYVDTVDEARQAVFDQLDVGADLIKLSMENGYAGRSGLPLLDQAQLEAIVTAAHERGKRVSAHITQGKYLEMVVEAGVDDAAHVVYDFVSDDVIATMVANDIYMNPTLTVLEAFGTLPSAKRILMEMVDGGVQIALGNDYTRVPQNGFDHFDLGMPVHEIMRMAEAGITPMQIIVSATRNAAHVCALDSELGTLEVGKIADVLVVAGNPLEDLNVLTQVKLVIHAGTIIRQE